MTGTTEDAWLAWAARHGVPVRARAAAPLVPCYELMNTTPVATPGLMVALGQLQAWLHERPYDDAPGPFLDRPAALARLDGADESLVRRLVLADPGPSAPAPCHGDFTPVTVLVDPDDHRDVAITGWGAAVVCDREHDVAYTELGLWASPYLTDDRDARPLLKVARSFLLNGYRAGYAAVAGAPDADRVRWWRAFHACRLLAAPLETAEPFASWDQDVATATVAAFRTDLAAHVDDLLSPSPCEPTDREATR